MTFSDHFKKSLVLTLIICVCLFGYFSCLSKNILQQEHAIPLKPGVSEEISFDHAQHRITVTTPRGTTSQYSRDGKVDIMKNGNVVVKADRFGFEHSPFIGIGYGDAALRLNLGVSVAYMWRFDVSGQVGVAMSGGVKTIVPVLSLSYNFYQDTSVYVGTNPLPLFVGLPATPHVGISVKF